MLPGPANRTPKKKSPTSATPHHCPPGTKWTSTVARTSPTIVPAIRMDERWNVVAKSGRSVTMIVSGIQ